MQDRDGAARCSLKNYGKVLRTSPCKLVPPAVRQLSLFISTPLHSTQGEPYPCTYLRFAHLGLHSLVLLRDDCDTSRFGIDLGLGCGLRDLLLAHRMGQAVYR
jgi:hypothetical protein